MATMKKTGIPTHLSIGKSHPQKSRKFKISVRLETEEVFPLNSVYSEMKIKELKSEMEFHCGLPYHLQKLHYLDEADLMEHTDLRHNDIVPGAILQCDVWPMWLTLLEAVAAKDIEWLFRLGVTQNTDYRTPHSDYMTLKSRRAWIADRAVVALIMAVHRGNNKMVEKLIEAGANVNGTTPLGRTPLHIAAGRGNGKVVDLLLQKGADFNAADHEGNTASTYASRFGHKDCERHLFLFQWKQRATNMKPEFQNLPRMAHQYHDSKFPVWLSGAQVQRYYSSILPPGEFEGTALYSPKKRHRPTSAPTSSQDLTHKQLHATKSDQEAQVDLGKETLEAARKQSSKAAKHRDYLTSILGRSSKAEFTNDRLSAHARRRLDKDVNDSDLYGLVDIDDSKEKGERVMNSSYGRGLAYSKIYGHRRKSNPRSFDDWVRRKTQERRLVIEKQKLEEEAEARKREERRVARLDKQRELEDWILETTADAARLPSKSVVEKIRNTFRERRELTSYDLWVMKKEVEALERVKQESQTSVEVT